MNLKNSLIGLLLMAVSAGAMAEWTKIATAYNNEFDDYMDFSTIRKSGNTAKMWILWNYKKVKTLSNGKSYLSNMIRWEYDCNEEKFRMLSSYYYSGNMKNNEIVASSDVVSEWNSIPPESISATELKIACSAK